MKFWPQFWQILEAIAKMASFGSEEAMTASLAEKSCKDVQLIIELNTTHLERLRRTASEERTSGEIQCS